MLCILVLLLIIIVSPVDDTKLGAKLHRKAHLCLTGRLLKFIINMKILCQWVCDDVVFSTIPTFSVHLLVNL
jgi:hypothetical protein